MTSKRSLACHEAFLLAEGYAGLGPEGDALRVTSRDLIENDFAVARGESLPTSPIEFVHDQGRTPDDLIGTTYATLVLVSERFLGVLRSHGFSGWTALPVTVFLDSATELEGYAGLAVRGRCGPIDDRLSEDVILPPPAPGGRATSGLRGLCFDPATWDGSDFFTAETSAGRFVVARVKEALEEARLTNVEFRRLSEIERFWRADGSLIRSG